REMSLSAAFRSAGKRVLDPIWRRLSSRVDQRVAPLVAEISDLRNALNAEINQRQHETHQRWLETNHAMFLLGNLTKQHGALEDAWRQHLPSFLNAISSVAAFGFELAALRRELSERTRSIEALTDAHRRETKNHEDALIELRGRLEDGESAISDT